MRYTYCSPSPAATEAHLDSYARRFAEDGFAPWTAELADEDGRVVGWGGLNRDPKEPHWGVEVAYFIDPSHWGRGLATELVETSLELAFRDLGLAEVLAFARPANVASLRVLEKAGFRTPPLRARAGAKPAPHRSGALAVEALIRTAVFHGDGIAGAGPAA